MVNSQHVIREKVWPAGVSQAITDDWHGLEKKEKTALGYIHTANFSVGNPQIFVTYFTLHCYGFCHGFVHWPAPLNGANCVLASWYRKCTNKWHIFSSTDFKSIAKRTVARILIAMGHWSHAVFVCTYLSCMTKLLKMSHGIWWE